MHDKNFLLTESMACQVCRALGQVTVRQPCCAEAGRKETDLWICFACRSRLQQPGSKLFNVNPWAGKPGYPLNAEYLILTATELKERKECERCLTAKALFQIKSNAKHYLCRSCFFAANKTYQQGRPSVCWRCKVTVPAGQLCCGETLKGKMKHRLHYCSERCRDLDHLRMVLQVKLCAICPEEGKYRCIKCQKRHYCCKEHQKEDWSNHKNNCNSAKN